MGSMITLTRTTFEGLSAIIEIASYGSRFNNKAK